MRSDWLFELTAIYQLDAQKARPHRHLHRVLAERAGSYEQTVTTVESRCAIVATCERR